MIRGRGAGTARALAVLVALALVVVSSGCTSGDEKGDETVYEIVDPPSTSPVAPSTTRPVPDPSLAGVVTTPPSADAGLVPLLTVAPRTGSAKALRLTSATPNGTPSDDQVCSARRTLCGPPQSLAVSVACRGGGRLVVRFAGEPRVDGTCDELGPITAIIQWPLTGARTVDVTVTAPTTMRWAMRIEQLVAQQ